MAELHYVAVRPRRLVMRRAILASLVVGATVAAWRLTPPLWQHAQYRYWQSRCLGFAYPPETVLFDDDRTRYDELSAREPGAFRGKRIGEYQALFRLPPPCAAPAGIFRAEDGFAFLHERTTSSGNQVLVAAYYHAGHDGQGGHDLSLQVSVFTPAGARPGSRLSYAGRGTALARTAGPLRVLAGQADPTDGSRFTITYEAGGRRQVLEGRVLDPRVIPKTDGSVAYCGNALGYQVEMKVVPED